MRGFFIFFGLLFCSLPILAQESALSRVSVTERSDGKGYVIRYHLSQKIDSFNVIQPVSDLIQMTLYSDELDTTNISRPAPNPVLDEISLYDIPMGIGVDFYVKDSVYFKADAYEDKYSNDILLGLTYASREHLISDTNKQEPIIWSQYIDEKQDMIVDASAQVSPISLLGEEYKMEKNRMRFDIVVIDAGHGGKDPGSIGYKGVQEKDIVLSIAKKVGAYINEYIPDVKVVYTRDDDTFIGLYERGEIANKAGGDLFVSIHCNSFHSSRPKGTEVYFLGLEKSRAAREVIERENRVINGTTKVKELTPEDLLLYELVNSGYMAASEKIASMLDHQFKHRAQRPSRGVKQGRLVVLHEASMPSILVETGFISNPSEQRYLSSDYGQSIIASAIFRAIRDYKEEYEKSQHFNTN